MKLKVFFELETLEQVAAVLAIGEELGLPLRMSPMLEARSSKSARYTAMRHAQITVGDKSIVPQTGASAQYWTRIEKLLKERGPLTKSVAVARLAKLGGLDPKRAGYIVASLLRLGALVYVDDAAPAAGDAG